MYEKSYILVWIAWSEEAFFCPWEFRRQKEIGGRFYPVKYDWFEDFKKWTVKKGMCSEKSKVYRNDKVSNRVRRNAGLGHIYLENTASSMKRGAFVMYPVQQVLVNFTIKC